MNETLDRLGEWEGRCEQDEHVQLIKDIDNLLNNRFDQMEQKISTIVEKKIAVKQVNDQAMMKTSFADTLKKTLMKTRLKMQ